MGTAVAPNVARHAHLFLLWLDLVAVPELAAAVLQEQLQPGYQEFGAVRLGRFPCWRRRRQFGGNPVGWDFQEDRQRSLCQAERHRCCLCRRVPVASSDPVHSRHHDRRPVPVRWLLLCGARDWSDMVGADGHCSEIFWYGLGPDEYRLCVGGDCFAFGGWLRDRRDRQLVLAVPDVDGFAGAWRVLRVSDASRDAVRRRRRASGGWTTGRCGMKDR